MPNQTHSSALDWAERLLPGHFCLSTMLQPDAGARCYYRLNSRNSSMLLVDQSNKFSKKHEFRTLQQSYTELGLIVPQTIYASTNDDFLLIDDMGKAQLEDILCPNNADTIYRQALNILNKIAKLPEYSSYSLKVFDKDFFIQELDFFVEWYIKKYRSHTMSSKQLALLQASLTTLAEKITQQPRCGIHRDYHSRNLMYLANNSIGIVDFQDSAIGPITYDAVSLLYDAYTIWPVSKIENWLRYHYRSNDWISEQIPENTWMQYCSIMSVQRHLKALGTFARKLIHDNAQRYLPALQNTERYLQKNLPQHEELFIIAQWIRY